MKFKFTSFIAFLLIVLKLNAQQNDSLTLDYDQIEKDLK